MRRRKFVFGLLSLPFAKLAFAETDSQRTFSASEAEAYCFNQSVVLRRYKRETKWAICKAVSFLPGSPEDGRSQWCYRSELHNYLRQEARAEFSGILLWILLYIILPIVVKLIIEWFFRCEGST